MTNDSLILLTGKESARYIVLDLLRGLAAIAVLLYHANYMLGSYALNLHKGYLAVDFFFMLSGFVISANYHATVRGSISWPDFLSVRVARLWPLFLLSTLLGAVAVVVKLTRDSGYFDAYGVLSSLAVNGLMLPSFFQAYGVDRLFVFNGASWSVFFEVLINLVFFAFLRTQPLKTMCILSAAFAGFLSVMAQANGSLDGGWSAATFHVGSARVLFGFTAGMAVYLIGRHLRFHSDGPAALVPVAGLALSFFLNGTWLVDCALVILAFPLLLLLASRGHLTGLWARLGGRLGDISYSVYLLQTPAMLFAAGACQKFSGQKIAGFAPVSGVLFITGLLGISFLSWRYFELPAQRLIRRRLGSRQQRPSRIPERVA